MVEECQRAYAHSSVFTSRIMHHAGNVIQIYGYEHFLSWLTTILGLYAADPFLVQRQLFSVHTELGFTSVQF